MRMTVTLDPGDRRIFVSQGVIDVLDSPRQVQMLLNPERRLLMLRPCSTEEKWAQVVPPGSGRGLEISGAGVLKKIRSLTGWTDDGPRTMEGIYIPQQKAVVFRISDARPVDLRGVNDDE